jgi:hypothetical protein
MAGVPNANIPLRPYTQLKYKVVSKEYGDANMQPIEAHYNKRIAEAPGPRVRANGTLAKFSLRQTIEEEKERVIKDMSERKDILRNISIQTIPKGTLLYHYYNHIAYKDEFSVKNTTNPISEEQYHKEQIVYYFSRFAFQNIIYNKEDDTVVFELSRGLVNPKYYFGVPYVVYGIGVAAGQMLTYNTMLPVVVKDDMHIAYLNSGSEIPDETTLHREYPDKYFNYQRASTCDKLTNIKGTQYNGKIAGRGDGYDECLRKQFAAEESLDGITAIAASDIIMKYDNIMKEYIHGATYGNLYSKIQRYKDLVARPESTDYQKSIYTTIMLGLNQDTRGNTDNIGFKEYALHPFGKKGYKGEHFLPAPTDASYTIVESVEGEYQKISVPFANFQAVYTRYIEPNLIVKPLRIFDSKMYTKDESIAPDSLFSSECKDFLIHRKISEKAGRIQPPVPIPGQVAHSLFFDWLLDSQYTFLFNPLVNLFGIYKDGYPYSYPPLPPRYRNDFEVNTAIPEPDRDHIKQQYTNVGLGWFLHILTRSMPDGTYALDSAAINSALECTIVKAVLADESRRMVVYSYLPIWNAENPVSTGSSKAVLIGPFFELQNTHIIEICKQIYEGITFPFNMNGNDALVLSIAKRFAAQDGVYYLGKIVPPAASLGGRRRSRRRTHKQTQKRRRNKRTLKTK